MWCPEVFDLWRGLVRVAPGKFWLRGEPTAKPRKFFCARWRAVRRWWSIFVWHHHRDGGLRVVHVERATSSDELHKAGWPVVGVFAIQRDGAAVGVAVAAEDGKARHPDNIPKSSGFVMAGHVHRD